jgi:hypothetical protein
MAHVYRFTYESSVGITDEQQLLTRLVGSAFVDLLIVTQTQLQSAKPIWDFIKKREDFMKVSSWDEITPTPDAGKLNPLLVIHYSPTEGDDEISAN